jgi:hypothetical protein
MNEVQKVGKGEDDGEMRTREDDERLRKRKNGGKGRMRR